MYLKEQQQQSTTMTQQPTRTNGGAMATTVNEVKPTSGMMMMKQAQIGAVIRTPGTGQTNKSAGTSSGSGPGAGGGSGSGGPPPAPVYKPASPPSTPTSPTSRHGSLQCPRGGAGHHPLEHISDAVDSIMDDWEAELAKHVRHRRRSGQFDSCNYYSQTFFFYA